MFYRAPVGAAGEGENNEVSEDKTKLPSASSPCPALLFIPHRAWSSRVMTQDEVHSPEVSSTCPCTILSHSSHHSSCYFKFTVLVLIPICYYCSLYSYWLLIVCVFLIRNYTSLNAVFLEIILHERLMLKQK